MRSQMLATTRSKTEDDYSSKNGGSTDRGITIDSVWPEPVDAYSSYAHCSGAKPCLFYVTDYTPSHIHDEREQEWHAKHVEDFNKQTEQEEALPFLSTLA
jgi:hypothetical protein